MNQPIIIYPWMLHDLRLQGAALLIFAVWFRDKELPSTRDLAQTLNLAESGVRKALPTVKKAIQKQTTLQSAPQSAPQSALQSALQSVEDKERSKEKEDKREINTTTSSRDAREDWDGNTPYSWLTDDEETLRALCMNNGLQPAANDKQGLAAANMEWRGW